MNSANGRRRTTKLPVDTKRIRHMPTQFAPIDRRLVYDRHICRLTHQQLSLYVFLQCVGDAAGLSYYSDGRICEYLNFTLSQLHDARQGLIQRQFILYRKPIYQLLDLPQSSCRRDDPTERPGEAVAISAVVSELCAAEFSS